MNEIVTRLAEIESRVNSLTGAGINIPATLQAQGIEISLCKEKITELEAKVESLTRTLDLWQELTGIEIVARPVVKTHMGTCELCDRVGALNDANICEGCFYEEIGV